MMIIWEILFSLLMVVTLPYKIKKLPYSGHNLYTIHVSFMPWASGMTIGRLLFTKYSPKELEKSKQKAFIHHEFQHYKQWLEYGWKFLPLYVWSSIDAFFKGKHLYYDNKFEIQAYKAEYEFRRKNNMSYFDRYKDDE